MDDNGLVVDAAGVAAYTSHAATSAAHLATAAACAEAASPELLGPVFGLIGGEFVQSYRTLHTAHFGAVGRLATTIGSMSAAAGNANATYAAHDAHHAGVLGAAREETR